VNQPSLPQQQPPEILGGLIPRNGQALVAYYFGLINVAACILWLVALAASPRR
jgi:hypothetical protein